MNITYNVHVAGLENFSLSLIILWHQVISRPTVRHTCGCSCWPGTWTSADTWGTSTASLRYALSSGWKAAAFVGNWCHTLDTENSRVIKFFHLWWIHNNRRRHLLQTSSQFQGSLLTKTPACKGLVGAFFEYCVFIAGKMPTLRSTT